MLSLEDIEELFDNRPYVQPRDTAFMAEGIYIIARSGRILFRFEGDYYKYDRSANENRKELELIEMLKGSDYLKKLAWAEYATRKINIVEYVPGTELEDHNEKILTEVTAFVVKLRKDFGISLRDVHNNGFNVILTPENNWKVIDFANYDVIQYSRSWKKLSADLRAFLG